jgi:glucose-1-phosphatase
MRRLCIFDQGGLVTRNFDIIPEASRLMGLEEARLREALQPDMQGFMSGKISEDEVWKRLEERCGISAAKEYWSELFRPSIDDRTFRLINSLRRPGLRVVCGTNTITSHYGRLRDLGHFECYDKVYASHLMGLAKPDPDFWAFILEAEGVRASECFFADDMRENVDAASALGIESVRFRSAEELSRYLAPERAPSPSCGEAQGKLTSSHG